MSQLNTFVTRLNGESFDLNSLGVVTQDFVVSSPEYEHETHEIEGRHGHVTTATKIKARKINVLFYMQAQDNADFAVARDKVFPLFASGEPFYIADGRAINREWLVRQNGSWQMDQQGRYGFFEVEFVADLPYSRTKFAVGDSIEWDDDAAAWDGLNDWGVQRMPIVSTQTGFNVKNGGNVKLDGINTPYTFKVTGVTTNYFRIVNSTNGTAVQYKGDDVTPSDVFTFDGIRLYKNGTAVQTYANSRRIVLESGINRIVLGGTSGTTQTSFSFHEYNL